MATRRSDCSRSAGSPQVLLDKARLDRVQVDQGQGPAAGRVEQDVVELGVAVDHPLADQPLGAGILQHPGERAAFVDPGETGVEGGALVVARRVAQPPRRQVAIEVGRRVVKAGQGHLEPPPAQLGGETVKAPEHGSHLAGLIRRFEPGQGDRVGDQLHQAPQGPVGGPHEGCPISPHGQGR